MHIIHAVLKGTDRSEHEPLLDRDILETAVEIVMQEAERPMGAPRSVLEAFSRVVRERSHTISVMLLAVSARIVGPVTATSLSAEVTERERETILMLAQGKIDAHFSSIL